MNELTVNGLIESFFDYYKKRTDSYKFLMGFNFNELTFSFKAYGKRVPEIVEQELKIIGFVYSDKSKSYRKTIVVQKGEDIGDGTFLGMSVKLQKQFLEDAYQKYAEPIIKTIIPKI